MHAAAAPACPPPPPLLLHPPPPRPWPRPRPAALLSVCLSVAPPHPPPPARPAPPLQRIDSEVPAAQRGDLLIFVAGAADISTLCEALTPYAQQTRRWGVWVRVWVACGGGGWGWGVCV